MPPKKVSLPPNPPPHASQSIPLQYTTFFSVAPLNAKNVASSYLKTEAQTWIARAQSASQSQPHSRKRRIDALRDAADAAPDASMNYDDDDDLDANDGEKEAAENTPAHRTIVIHPGSESLRLGRATDLFPIVIPNVIARRAKKSSSSTHQTAGSSNANGTPAEASEGEDADVDMTDAGESPNKLDQDAGDAATSLRKNPRRSAANAHAQQEPSSDASQDDADAEATPKRSLADGIEAIRNDLRAIMRQEKLRSVGNAKNLAANYNDSSQPEDVPEHNDLFGLQWTDEDAGGDNEVLVGEQALRLACFSQPKTAEPKQNQRRQQQQQSQAASIKPLSPPDAHRPWTLFRPFQRGTLDLNTYEQHYGASAAARALLGDVRCILEKAITSPPEDTDERQETGKVAPIGLGIPRTEFAGCSVILIVPDLFCKSDIKALTELLLVDMGFAQACIQQESVCATFGAGLSTGCVVDLGAEKISVSCVEEGLVLPETRVQLAYGGADLTRFLGELLVRAKFPYRELDVRASIADTLLLDELKRRLVTLNPADVGLNIHDFYLRLPSRPTKKYLFRTYDELILAPMSLFDPSVYGLDAKSSLKRRQRAGYVEEEAEDGVAEDTPELSVVRGLDVPVTAAMTSCVKHLLPADPTPAPAPAVSAPDTGAVASEAGTPAPAGTDGGSGMGVVDALCAGTMMGELPASDPISILVQKHLPAHARPVRDLSGTWNASSLDTTEVSCDDIVQAASTGWWRKIAVLARSTLERRGMELDEVLEWWTVRLYALARLRLHSMLRTELAAVWEALEGQQVPFGLLVLRASEAKFRGDTRSTVEQYTVLIHMCKKKQGEAWRRRAVRLGIMLAFTLAEARDYNAAINVLDPLVERALAEEEEGVQLVVVAARIWIQAGDVEHALELVERAEQQLPKQSAAHAHIRQAKMVIATISGDFAAESQDAEEEGVVATLNRAVVQFYRAQLDAAIATLDAQLEAELALVASADAVVFNTATLYELAAGDEAAVVGRKRQLLATIARWAAEPGPTSSAFKL
ncbi:40S ribosomal protein S14 [Moesziomyces antarcticus T-34]|uniref:40S ribosomal protein S14 n=1 Tax=Pseudozyma antarctica (strain T-34) TaxID=1151754 RepID=M9M8G5_PSEA3|nr:40S ribosomal protein S14 [Moesziomyces antarcticus T-34]